MAESVARVLEMMHPMREPPQPTSLSPFLFALALGSGVAVAVLLLIIRARRQRSELRHVASALLAQTRSLAPAERLAAQAALLRRLVRSLAGEGDARKQGSAWLESLDRVFRTRVFTEGAGVAYGEALYGSALPDVDALDVMLAGLFARLVARAPSRLGGTAAPRSTSFA